MPQTKREILSQVAAGVLSPEEAAARLVALEAETPAAPQPAAAPDLAAARRVRVISQFGSAEIVGDPSVAFAVADGPHRVHQEGDTMVIEHEALEDVDSFSFGRTARRFFLDGFDYRQRRLTVRMHPDLALTATVQAGDVRVESVHGPIAVDVQAGNCIVRDFRNTIHLSTQAGNIVASGRLDGGESDVECEMGSVKLNLEKGSSVRVIAKSTMGKVSIGGSAAPQQNRVGSRQEVTIGRGTGTLEIDCAMGMVRVNAE